MLNRSKLKREETAEVPLSMILKIEPVFLLRWNWRERLWRCANVFTEIFLVAYCWTFWKIEPCRSDVLPDITFNIPIIIIAFKGNTAGNESTAVLNTKKINFFFSFFFSFFFEFLLCGFKKFIYFDVSKIAKQIMSLILNPICPFGQK